MVKYVALLRGISPSNPNARNENLRRVFEDLGVHDVQTVISSGNVLFETQSENTKVLEALIEKTLFEDLDLKSTTIICSKGELESLVDKNPFKEKKDTSKSRLNVTFLKENPKIQFEFPYQSENKGFLVLGIQDRAICSIVDLRKGKTPDLMSWLEKEFGKNITTRTWKTIGRILKRLNEP